MSIHEKCPVIKFKEFGDKRGQMVIVEGNESIPFEIKRVFYIYGTVPGVIRGQHANKESEFVLINVSGTSKVKITDGKESMVVDLDEPMKGIYIPKMMWKDMYDFSADSVLLVLSSAHYDAGEYIRNYENYIQMLKEDRLFA